MLLEALMVVFWLLVILKSFIAIQYNSSIYHIVKANYIESDSSLNEEYHQSVSLSNHSFSGSSLGENNDTIWHVFSTYSNVIYFQYNLTDFSTIGANRFISSTGEYSWKADIGVGQGMV